MNSGPTAERVYDALKRRILHREFRPGDKLDLAALSETLNSTVTPVRDCLNTLRGEALVESRASEGFHLPHVNAPALRDLYAWNAEVLGAAIRRWRPTAIDRDPGLPDIPETIALADATAATFAIIARRSPNLEHRRAIGSANDRLHAARVAETQVLDDARAELTALHDAIARGRGSETRRLVAAYHRRRQRAADAIVQVLYRNGDY